MRHAGLWWAPRHGDVAEPMQLGPYSAGIGPLRSKFHRFGRMRGVCGDQQPVTRPPVLLLAGWFASGPARGKCPAPTPPHTLKTTELTADSSEIGHTTQDCVTQDCVGSATSPCRGAHHRPACRMAAEGYQNTSAAAAQLQATPCQPRSSKVKDVERQEQRRARPDRKAPSAPLLCLASSLVAVWRRWWWRGRQR